MRIVYSSQADVIRHGRLLHKTAPSKSLLTVSSQILYTVYFLKQKLYQFFEYEIKKGSMYRQLNIVFCSLKTCSCRRQFFCLQTLYTH